MPHYNKHAVDIHRVLRIYLSAEQVDSLHSKEPLKHFQIAARQLLLLIGLPVLIYLVPQFWVWIPASIVLGFVVFGFSVLLHEVIHFAVFKEDKPLLTNLLGHTYAIISGLTYSQFKKWHLDHHKELGSEEDDPKRAHLSPKKNKRWYKLLYWTPALFPIYFIAAARAKNKYPNELQQQIRRERLTGIAIHLSVLATFLWIDPQFAFKAYVFPVFFVFPVAFSINRLGQHYVINPENPANWSTLMRPNRLWNFLFLFSSYHLEHHYFPAVPFYKLKALQKSLDQFYRDQKIPHYSYWQLIKLWFVDNHKAHTNPDLISETIGINKKQKLAHATISDTVQVGHE